MLEQDAYSGSARNYDRYVEPFNRVLRKIALKLTAGFKAGKILEVGCGTGSNLQLFAQKGWQVWGVDLSPAMLEEARKKLGRRSALLLGDAGALPYDSHTFDLALAMLTLHEMPPALRPKVLDEMKRVVKPGGHILLIDFHHGPFAFFKGWYYRAVIFFFERVAGGEHYRNFRDFMRRKGLPGLIDASDLKIVKDKIVGGGNIGFHLLRIDK